MRALVAWTAIVLGFISLSTQAHACQGTISVFDDKFTTLDPAWPNLATFGKIDNGRLVVTLPTQSPPTTAFASHSLNQNNIYTDMIACVSFSFDATQDPANTSFGLSFWGVDDSAYYTLLLSPNGYYEVSRKVADNRSLYPISWTASPVIKTELGQPQELEVHTKQNAAEIFINGTKIAEIKGIVPSGGGLVGFFFSMPASGATITLTEFQVRN